MLRFNHLKKLKLCDIITIKNDYYMVGPISRNEAICLESGIKEFPDENTEVKLQKSYKELATLIDTIWAKLNDRIINKEITCEEDNFIYSILEILNEPKME